MEDFFTPEAYVALRWKFYRISKCTAAGTLSRPEGDSSTTQGSAFRAFREMFRVLKACSEMRRVVNAVSETPDSAKAARGPVA